MPDSILVRFRWVFLRSGQRCQICCRGDSDTGTCHATVRSMLGTIVRTVATRSEKTQQRPLSQSLVGW